MRHYSGKHRYRGDAAVQYVEKRTADPRNQRKWNAELAGVARIMNSIPEGSLVLDVPCGTGRLFPVLYQRGCKIVGIDISEDMIQQIPREVLCNSHNVSVRVGDAESLDYPDSHFDYVLCMRFFDIVPNEVRIGALKEFARVASRGVFVQLSFCGYGPFGRFLIRVARIFSQKTNNIIKRLMVVGDKTAVSVSEEIRRPSLKEFRALVQSLGRRIVTIYRVDCGLTLNPMTICHLERCS